MKTLRDWAWLIGLGFGGAVFLLGHFAVAGDVERLKAEQVSMKIHLAVMCEQMRNVAIKVGATTVECPKWEP